MATQRKTTTEVAVPTKSTAIAIPDYGAKAGLGWENTDKSDFQIPFLNQLQSNSPQCTKGEPQYDAKYDPGMFLNSSTLDLYPDAVYLLIGLTKHSYVEWRPGGGSFVAEHEVLSDVVTKAKEKTENQLELKSEAGNELQETYQVFAILCNEDFTEVEGQVVFSFSRTKIKRYKQIMTRLRTFKGSDKIPTFAHRIKMVSTSEKNPEGKPYKNVSLIPAINNDVAQSLLPADSPLLEVANGLREAIIGGAARANFETAAPAAAGTSEEGGDGVFAD